MSIFLLFVAPVVLVALVCVYQKQEENKLMQIVKPVSYLKLCEYSNNEKLNEEEIRRLNQIVQSKWKKPLEKAKMLSDAREYLNWDRKSIISAALLSGYIEA